MNRALMLKLAEGKLNESFWGSSHDIHKSMKMLSTLSKEALSLESNLGKFGRNESTKAMQYIRTAKQSMAAVVHGLEGAKAALDAAAKQIEQDEDEPVDMADIESGMGFGIHAHATR